LLKTVFSQVRRRKILAIKVINFLASSAGLKGPKISGSVVFHPAAEVDSREFFVHGDFNKGKAFVVLEPEIETGLVKLDVIIFYEAGLFFRVDQEIVYIGRLTQDVLYLEVG